MKAIVVREFGPPSALRLEEAAAPRPGAGEVVVRLRAIGVNPVETYLRSGKHARLPSLPWTPGTDGAGVVEAVGPGVSGPLPGDYVYTAGSRSGTYAEFCLCTPMQARPLPERLTFAQGAAIHVPYATAWRALVERAQLRKGETVFVHGASGAVGLAAVQIARTRGADVLGSAGSEAGRAAVLAAGARDVVDHRQAGHCDEVVRLTQGKGPEVILEMLADKNLDDDLSCCAPRGRIVVIGSRGRIEIEPRRAMTRDLSVLGVSLPNATIEELDAIHRALLPLFESGTLVPVVRTELPLAEAARAHELVMQPGALGKIVLVP